MSVTKAFRVKVVRVVKQNTIFGLYTCHTWPGRTSISSTKPAVQVDRIVVDISYLRRSRNLLVVLSDDIIS